MPEGAGAPGARPSRLVSLLLSLSSACLLGLALPNPLVEKGFSPLAWLALAPLFAALKSSPPLRAAGLGASYAALAALLSGYSLAAYAPAALALALLVAAAWGALCLPLVGVLLRRGAWASFAAAALWAGAELLRGRGFLGHSYGILGLAFYASPLLARIAALGGVAGLSFLAAGSAALLSAFVPLLPDPSPSRATLRSVRLPALAWLLVLAACLGFSALWRPAPPDEGLRLLLVQPGHGDGAEGLAAWRADFERLRLLGDAGIAASDRRVELLAWPETAIGFSLSWWRRIGGEPARGELARGIEAYMAGLGTPLLYGNALAAGEAAGIAGSERRSHNAAILREGATESAYRKSRLVPFAESFPPGERFPALGGLVRRLFGEGWVAGEGPALLLLRRSGEAPLPFGAPICFEDGFASHCAGFARLGALFLVVLTNDAWAGSASFQRQHLAQSVFRAVETGLPVARVAVTGLTAALAPDGRTIGELEPFRPGFLPVDLPLAAKPRPTPWLLVGDLPLALAAGAALALALASLAAERRVGKAGSASH